MLHTSMAPTNVTGDLLANTREVDQIFKTHSRGPSTGLSQINFIESIREKQKGSVPLSEFSHEERAFMARRNHRMIQNKRKLNELTKT